MMEEVRVPDNGGDTITCIDYNGFRFPNFDHQIIKGISSIKIRENDIFVIGYPKSGNHWIWEISRQLLSGTILKDDLIMTFVDKIEEKEYVDMKSPRILTTHCPLEYLSPEVLHMKPKLINIIRNPKDVTVSMFNFMKTLSICHYQGKWENFIEPFINGKFMYGSWVDHLLAWEKIKTHYPDWPIHTVFYEDMQQDPVEEMKKLCHFLEVERTEDFLKDVQQVCNFDSMTALKPPVALTWLRKGKVGDWKNWFTVAQSEWIDNIIENSMKDCSLKFRFTIDGT